MAAAHDEYGKGLEGGDIDSGSDRKGQSQHIGVQDPSYVPEAAIQPRRTFEAPEFIRNMTPEKRKAVETRLKRKIDLRLMPMIVLMYILNYLDRVSLPGLTLISSRSGLMTPIEQHCRCEIGRNCTRLGSAWRTISGISPNLPRGFWSQLICYLADFGLDPLRWISPHASSK